MKKLAICLMATVALIGTPVLAADLNKPVYKAAPPPPPVPVYSWTGFYVGGNVGYSWGRANDDLGFLQTDLANLATFGATDSNKVNGVIGGGQAGFNWQVNNFVYGIETDFQASGQKGTNNFDGLIINGSSPPNFGNNPATVTDTTKLDWFGTTRVRAGLAWDRWLVYGTGGVAYGEVKQNGNILPANPPGFPGANAPIVWDQSSSKVGWAVGAGVENAITGNWSWKLEYLYMDLGTVTANVSGGVGNIGNLSVPDNCYNNGGSNACNGFRNAATGTVTSHFTDNIVRVGINYKFN
jgi:outer membrane immunogenic protein